jgi:predicted 3-demethylubiquinone-9 3-methyltransferase (glyoxalase superfamily)
MSTITPHLWFDTQAKEAAEFYAAVFPDSSVTSVTTLRDTTSTRAGTTMRQIYSTRSGRSSPTTARC